jgi:hypothetical protein
MSNDKNKNIVVFADSIGRTIVGGLESETNKTLTVKNPAVLNVQPNPQTGQIQVQLIPYFFKEFVKGGTGTEVTWEFVKSNIARASNVELDDRLVSQYENMYSVIQTPEAGLVGAGAGTSTGDAPVVKLFDD